MLRGSAPAWLCVDLTAATPIQRHFGEHNPLPGRRPVLFPSLFLRRSLDTSKSYAACVTELVLTGGHGPKFGVSSV